MKAPALVCALLFLFVGQLVYPFPTGSVLTEGSSVHQKKISPDYRQASYNIHLNSAVDDYASFISSLNPNNLFSIGTAEKKYKEMFDKSPNNIADQAFVKFWNFYLAAADSAAERLVHNNRYKYLISIKNYNTNPADYKNLKFDLTLNKKILNENDFRLLSLLNSYGLMFAVKDGLMIINFGSTDFLLNNFGNSLSEAMRAYLSETFKEANESLIENDKIVLPAEKIAERTIWWENFINSNQDFVLLPECKLTYNFYLSTLMHGIADSTASFSVEPRTEKEFRKAYRLIIQKYSSTKTADK